MAILIILAALVAGSLGYSPLPIMVIGGVALSITAYKMSQNRALLRMSASLALFACGALVIKTTIGPVLTHGAASFELKALQFVTSAELLMVMSAAVMLASVMLGISGSTPNATSKLIGYTLNQDDQKN
jgi:hypothetical protein